MRSRWAIYDLKIKEVLSDDSEPIEVAKFILGKTETVSNLKEFSRYIRRNHKRLLDMYEGVYTATDSADVSASSVKHLWLKNKGASLFVKNPDYVEPQQQDINELRAKLIDDLKSFSPVFPSIERETCEDGHLLVIDPADIHIGKLCSSFETGEDYDSQIAVNRVRTGVHGLLNKANGFKIDKIIFVGGNDVLHIDNSKSSTTSGTLQDTTGMWYDNFIIAKNLYVELITILAKIADVHFIYNPSNHDYTNGFMLCQVIQAYFINCPNVTFDNTMAHRKYYAYGSNLIGTTHGDGAKIADLPLLMAHECPEWSGAKHRYIYTHHVHHKISKDYMGVCVESLRSPSSADSWHHRNGFQHAPKAIEGYLHHKRYGQVARLTNIF